MKGRVLQISFCPYFIYFFIFNTEREENVKNDIFHAYISLLRQTRPVATSSSDAMDAEDG